MSKEKKALATVAAASNRAPWNPFDVESHYNDRERQLSRIDSAWAKCALALRTDMRFGHGIGQMRMEALPRIWDKLEARRTRFQRGDTMEILHAIALCAEENLPLPTWLAIAYRAAFEPFLMPGGAKSLDAVFSSSRLPTSTSKKAATARQDWQLGVQLYIEVWNVAEKHNALDSALREVLSMKAWGVEKTKARKLVEMVETTHCELAGVRKLSQFWANPRKEMRGK